MKRILALSLCLGLALTQVGQAKDNNNKKAKQHANKQAAVAQHNANVAHKQNVKAQRNVQAQRNVYRASECERSSREGELSGEREHAKRGGCERSASAAGKLAI